MTVPVLSPFVKAEREQGFLFDLTLPKLLGALVFNLFLKEGILQ